MYKGTEYRDYDKSLLDRSTLFDDSKKYLSNPLTGSCFRKYGDHFIKLKDLGEYELNFIRDDHYLAFFLCKKEELGTVDLACFAMTKTKLEKYGSKKYKEMLKEAVKEFSDEEF